MMFFTHIPDGITLKKMDKEWQVWAHNQGKKNIYLLLFHLVGLLYILFAETLLILDFVEHWRENSSSWLLLSFYAIQDCLFLWIVKEMVQSTRRLIQSQKRVLLLHLQEKRLGIFLQNNQSTTLKEQWYSTDQLQAIYYNRGPQQKGTDTLAGLLNIPYELYIVSSEQSIDNWGGFLTIEQLHFLTSLLQDVYENGKEVEELLG